MSPDRPGIPRMVALVFFDIQGDPLDADCLPVDSGVTPVQFIRSYLRDMGRWPVGAVLCKGFFDAATPPLFERVPNRDRAR
ncbi:MAG TPA: hypothetical protein VKR31_10175 [Rhizomicrobium sp.]|nr:hypothetical protein [Rhizomicrobium sp.]